MDICCIFAERYKNTSFPAVKSWMFHTGGNPRVTVRERQL